MCVVYGQKHGLAITGVVSSIIPGTSGFADVQLLT